MCGFSVCVCVCVCVCVSARVLLSDHDCQVPTRTQEQQRLCCGTGESRISSLNTRIVSIHVSSTPPTQLSRYARENVKPHIQQILHVLKTRNTQKIVFCHVASELATAFSTAPHWPSNLNSRRLRVCESCSFVCVASVRPGPGGPREWVPRSLWRLSCAAAGRADRGGSQKTLVCNVIFLIYHRRKRERER